MNDGILTILLILAISFAIMWQLRRLFVQRIIYEYERGLLYENGKFLRILEPGAYWLFGTSRNIQSVDIRPVTLALSGQEILSADAISLKLNMAAEYAISDPYRAIHGHQSYYQALYQALQVALREVISSQPVEQILADRKQIGESVAALAKPQAEALGLSLNLVQVKDITFPSDLKKVFAQVLRAQKEGLAALEKARGESAALRNLANAAKMLDNNPSLLQLRALIAVGESTGNTIVFHVPGGSAETLKRTNV